MEELVLMSSVSMLSLMPLLTELLSSQLDKSHAGNGHSYENGIAKEAISISRLEDRPPLRSLKADATSQHSRT